MLAVVTLFRPTQYRYPVQYCTVLLYSLTVLYRYAAIPANTGLYRALMALRGYWRDTGPAEFHAQTSVNGADK